MKRKPKVNTVVYYDERLVWLQPLRDALGIEKFTEDSRGLGRVVSRSTVPPQTWYEKGRTE